jgi:hypothetical protein
MRFAELGSLTFPEDKRGATGAKVMLKSEVEKWARLIKNAGVSSAK